MENYVSFIGTEDEIAEQFVEKIGLQDDDAYRMLYYILSNTDMLGNDEEITIGYTKYSSRRGITFAEEEYHISIKITTIVICALLLDITLTKGAASSLLSLSGVTTRGVAKLDDYKGQKCILRETLRTKDKVGNSHILEKFHGECCNNDIAQCKYRKGVNCICCQEEVEKVFEGLADNQVFVKDKNGDYRYCW